MMRNGILLAEDTPANIMQKFNCDNLEDAFLILCQKHGTSEEADTTLGRIAGQKFLHAATQQQQSTQETHQSVDSKTECAKSKDNSTTNTTTTTTGNTKSDEVQTNKPLKRKIKRNLSFHEQKPDTLIGKLTFTSQIRMKALLTKNLLQLIRQPS